MNQSTIYFTSLGIFSPSYEALRKAYPHDCIFIARTDNSIFDEGAFFDEQTPQPYDGIFYNVENKDQLFLYEQGEFRKALSSIEADDVRGNKAIEPSHNELEEWA